MSAALDNPGATGRVAGPGPALRRLLLWLALGLQVPLALAVAALVLGDREHRVDAAKGELRAANAALAARLDAQRPQPQQLQELLAATLLPAGWSAGIADGAGVVVAHSGGRALVGTTVPAAAAPQRQAAPAGTFDWTAPGGEPLVAAATVSPAHGWTSFVTVPRDVLLAPARQASGVLFLGLLALVALGLLGTAAALRASRRIVQALEPAAAATQRSRQQLAAVLRTEGNAIIVTDSAHHVVVFNDAAEGIFGRTKADMAGRSLELLFTPRSWQVFCRRFAAGGPAQSARPDRPAQTVCRRACGSTFAAELHVSQFVDAAGAGFRTVILRDITDRLRADRSLLAAHRQVQRMNDSFQRALMKEMDSRMAGIARELHDSVGSSLAGISLLAAGGRSLATEPRLVAILQKVQEQVNAATERVRQISRGLMPAGSDAGALLPALEQFAHAIRDSQRVACTVRSRGCFDGIAPEVGGHVHRIVQEATANALRHGNATRVRIVLAQAGERCRLTVEDNGSGCDLARVPAAHPGIGMKSMRARAAAVDGRLEVRARPGSGCRVSLTWRMTGAPA